MSEHSAITTRTWGLFAQPATAIANDAIGVPLRWRKPQQVGINGDLFHEAVPDEFLDRVFAVMALTPQHAYQVLTKRPERMREYLTPIRGDKRNVMVRILEQCRAITMPGNQWKPTWLWPISNVWLGTSVEDQAAADTRIPELLATPAAVRFLSVEPLLGPVDLAPVYPGTVHGPDWLGELDWLIVGGESGPGARPCDLAWIRSIVAQCRAAAVPVFVKQLGSRPRRSIDDKPMDTHGYIELRLRSRKGGDMSEWPEDLRVREWPGEGR